MTLQQIDYFLITPSLTSATWYSQQIKYVIQHLWTLISMLISCHNRKSY